jgi:hypothetical protein
VRTAVVVALLVVVLTATALDLSLGVLWVLALLGVLLLRRRVRVGAWLVLLLAATVLVWGGRLGWFPAPAPASYERGWIPPWGGSGSDGSLAASPADPKIVAARADLARLARDELRLTGPELEQRAGAVISVARRLDPLRSEAPGEVAAVEAAARRLARTLAASEFRDLSARRSAAQGYLTELDRRLQGARDAAEAVAVVRATDPAAMAHVSLRPVRDDLAAASSAVEALVRALGGGVPTAATTASARYDDERKETRWELRAAVAGAPGVRLLRLEARAFRGTGAPPEVPVGLTYVSGTESPRPVPPGPWLELEPAPRGVTVAQTWAGPASVRPVRATLRPVAFERLDVAPSGAADDVMITVVLDGRPGIEIPLAVRLPPPRLARVVVPRYALYFASRPGPVTVDPDGDRWEPAGDGDGPLRVDLVPRTFLLRNGAFGHVRDYLYRPNAGTVLTAGGLAALALVLIRRPRPSGGAPGS